MSSNNFICPVCGSGKTKWIKDMLICTRCGAILDDSIRYDEYSYINRNISNVDISQRDIERFNGVSSYNCSSLISKHIKTTLSLERRLIRYSVKVDEICDFLNLPSYIRLEARKLATKIASSFKKLNSTTVAILSIIKTARLYEYPLTYKEVYGAVMRLYGRKLERSKFIHEMMKIRKLGISMPKTPNVYILIDQLIYKLTTDKKVLNRLSRLNINLNEYIRKLRSKASEIYNMYKHYFIGKSPETSAATVLYLADLEISRSEKRRMILSQSIVSKIASVSKYTIRERVTEFYKRVKKDHSLSLD